MTSRHRRAAGLLAAAGVLLLSGCTADVTTGLSVTSATDAQVTAAVHLSGAVADKLNGDSKLRDQLVGVFTGRLHTTPDVRSAEHTLTLTAAMDYTALTGNADVLGVSGATLTGSGHAVTVAATLVDPAALRAAITRGVTGSPDADAVATTMVDSTTVTVDVHFPGGVTRADTTGGLAATRHGDDVTVVRPLSAAPAGTLTVTGDPTAPTRWPYWTLGGVALAAVGFVGRRRLRASR